MQQAEPLAQLSGARVHEKLLQLARDIRSPRMYIGYSAFLCFGLLFGCRPCIWEGEKKVDLIGVFAPWAAERCTRSCIVDGVCCCLEPAVAGGRVEMQRVSETRPLDRCRHFVAAVAMAAGLPDSGSSFEGLYSRQGMAVLGTCVA